MLLIAKSTLLSKIAFETCRCLY